MSVRPTGSCPRCVADGEPCLYCAMDEADAYSRTAAGQVAALKGEAQSLLFAVCWALGIGRLAAWLARKLA